MSEMVQRIQQGAKSISVYLQQKLTNIAEVLPGHMSAQRQVKLTLIQLSSSPKVALCTPKSVYRSLMQASQLGLEIGDGLGEAYLRPGWNKRDGIYECSLMIGYQGLLKLVRQSDKVLDVHAGVVHENDEILEYEEGPDPKLKFRRCLRGPRGDVIMVYAYAKLPGDITKLEIMSKDDVEQVRTRYASEESQAWADSWGEMAKKTALRRMLKLLPKNPMVDKATSIENNVAYHEVYLDPDVDGDDTIVEAIGLGAAHVKGLPEATPKGQVVTEEPAGNKIEALKKRIKDGQGRDSLKADAAPETSA